MALKKLVLVLQLAYKVGFISDSAMWVLMLKKRKLSVQVYNEEEVDELVSLIRDSFISTFTVIEATFVCYLALTNKNLDRIKI